MRFELCHANSGERRRTLPGDEAVAQPMGVITHAITIDAPPAAVWPWLVQMGSGRAGWYAFDHIDNDGNPSARRIIPELQRIAPGDVLPSLPGATDSFIVRDVIPEHALILVVPLRPGEKGEPLPEKASLRVSWAIILQPLDRERTRLISRGRIAREWLSNTGDVSPSQQRIFIERVYSLMARMPQPILLRFAGTGHYLMESRMLRGIKRRAEFAWGLENPDRLRTVPKAVEP